MFQDSWLGVLGLPHQKRLRLRSRRLMEVPPSGFSSTVSLALSSRALRLSAEGIFFSDKPFPLSLMVRTTSRGLPVSCVLAWVASECRQMFIKLSL